MSSKRARTGKRTVLTKRATDGERTTEVQRARAAKRTKNRKREGQTRGQKFVHPHAGSGGTRLPGDSQPRVWSTKKGDKE